LLAVYELSRIYANLTPRDEPESRRLLDLVLSGKMLEGSNARKGKYSMEVCHLSSSEALDKLIVVAEYPQYEGDGCDGGFG
jgi:hypothetical protein